MPLSKTELCALIPHAGTMCLLEAVQNWDDTRIVCSAISHRDSANPLRSQGRLHVLCGIEYGAQAMAVHGALSQGHRSPRPGFLAAVRDLTWAVERLDDVEGELKVEAECLLGGQESVLYAFVVSANGQTLLTGRASIFFLPQQDTTP